MQTSSSTWLMSMLPALASGTSGRYPLMWISQKRYKSFCNCPAGRYMPIACLPDFHPLVSITLELCSQDNDKDRPMLLHAHQPLFMKSGLQHKNKHSCATRQVTYPFRHPALPLFCLCFQPPIHHIHLFSCIDVNSFFPPSIQNLHFYREKLLNIQIP